MYEFYIKCYIHLFFFKLNVLAVSAAGVEKLWSSYFKLNAIFFSKCILTCNLKIHNFAQMRCTLLLELEEQYFCDNFSYAGLNSFYCSSNL